VKFKFCNLDLPKLEREHIGEKRFYLDPKDKNRKYVSITTITSFFNRHIFVEWRKKVGNEEADKITKASTTRGTDLHTLNECYLQDIEPPVVPEISQRLFSINKPALDKIGKIYGIEIGLYSLYLGIAGTCDLIAEYDGKLAIIDYKTSKKPKPREWLEHYFVQCCAYAFMLKELTGLEVEKLVIIMSCESGELVVYEETNIEKYIKLLVKYIKHYVEENA
jgi:genome maintenance exonuclease 1